MLPEIPPDTFCNACSKEDFNILRPPSVSNIAHFRTGHVDPESNLSGQMMVYQTAGTGFEN